MPTYKNISDQIQYVDGKFIRPNETIETEQIITDPDFQKISDDPIWSPLKFSQTYNLTAGATQEVSIPTPDFDMYVVILQNTGGVNIYNGTSDTLAVLLPNQLASFNTYGKIETLTLEAINDCTVTIAIFSEEVNID